MDRFVLQRQLLAVLCKTRPTMDEGLASSLKFIEDSGIKLNFRAARELAPAVTARSLKAWIAWADALHKDHPFPCDAQVVWAEVPNELNPAWTSLTAFETLMSKRDNYGTESDVAWPDEETDSDAHPSLQIPQLDALLASLGWKWDDEEPPAPRTLAAVYAMQTAFITLLLLNGLPQTQAWKARTREPLSVLVGWSDGDMQPIGTLTSKGWEKIARGKNRVIASNDRRLQPSEFGFDLSLFVKRGGDIHAKDRRGQSVLMQMEELSASDIRLLKELGADFRELNRDGENVLSKLGLKNLDALRAAIEAGADVNNIAKNGETPLMECHWRSPSWWNALLDAGADINLTGCNTTFLDIIVGNLWRPMALVRELEARGAKLGPQIGNPQTPLCTMVEGCAPLARAKRKLIERIRFCTSKGHDINLPKSEPPLWRVLKSFTYEAEWNQKYYAENPADFLNAKNKNQRYEWHKGNDDVAIFLLSHGASPNARLRAGHGKLIPKNATPLMVRRYQDAKLVKALLKAGADPSLRSAEGKTALDYAKMSARQGDTLANLGVDEVIAVLEAATPKAKRGKK